VSEVVVRKATLDDAATMALLFSEFNAILGADGLPDSEAFLPENVHLSPAQMAGRLQAMALVEQAFIAWLGEDPAGLACLRLVPYIGQDAPYAELTQLYVRPQYQRHGIGARLVAEVERDAFAAGATCLAIITGEDNLKAQAFYRAQGYAMPSVVFWKPFAREAAHA
jgi:ribosomal protein S18 acetylase RimI-like enzyme